MSRPIICDYCGEEIKQSNGRFSFPDTRTEEEKKDPGDMWYQGVQFNYHLECVIHMKFKKRGWL